MGQKTVRWAALATAVVLALGAAARDAAAQGSAAKGSASVVKVTATADKPGPDGKQVVHVRLAIDKGWHTYANPIGTDVGIPTAVTVVGKADADAQVSYPPGKAVKDPGGDYFIYEGDTTIDVTVRRGKDDAPLKVKVKIQACNDRTCLAPATVEASVP